MMHSDLQVKVARPIAFLAAAGIVACTHLAERAPSAATGQSAQSVGSVEYRCGDERVVVEHSGEALTLQTNGERYVLSRVRSASGAKYASAMIEIPVVFWEKGDKARFELSGVVYPECLSVVNANTPPSQPFTARGNEPGWTLSFRDDRMQLVRNYGQDALSLPIPEAQPIANGFRYRVTTDTVRIQVDIVNALCRDDMSGMPYPQQTTVRIDNEILTGCGGQPASLLRGEEWVVEDIDGRGVIDYSHATLSFDAQSRLSGSATCNRYSASYSLTGENLTVGPLAMTRRTCPPALMDQEAKFAAVLTDANAFDIDADGALIIKSTSDGSITARR